MWFNFVSDCLMSDDVNKMKEKETKREGANYVRIHSNNFKSGPY